MKKLIVDKQKLENNIDKIKAMTDARIIAVLKGNGYGLGILGFGHLLLEKGIDFFAVSEIQEAVNLRVNGFTNDILLLSSTCVKEEIELLVKNDIIATIGSELAGSMLNDMAAQNDMVARAHLKIDTGFGRFGFLPREIDDVAVFAKSYANINIIGTFSHLSFSFSKHRKDVQVQFDKFIQCVERLKSHGVDPGLTHIVNSSGFLKYKDMHLDGVRIGSAFLGRVPIQNTYGLQKIGYLKANISETKYLPKDHYIGYANTYKTSKEMRVAVVPIGYKDGFGIEKSKDIFRWIDILRYIYNDLKLFLGNKYLYVKVNGKSTKILGRISMYHIIIDISDINAEVGDEVIMEANPLVIESSIEREYI